MAAETLELISKARLSTLLTAMESMVVSANQENTGRHSMLMEMSSKNIVTPKEVHHVTFRTRTDN